VGGVGSGAGAGAGGGFDLIAFLDLVVGALLVFVLLMPTRLKSRSLIRLSLIMASVSSLWPFLPAFWIVLTVFRKGTNR